MSIITKEIQNSISPERAIEMLKEGNQRFLNKNEINRDLHTQVKETSEGQNPYAVVLSCIDSRVPVELAFDQGIGDIFSARVAGNIVNEDVLGSIEYACGVAGSKAILV
jgi:carbonic anhydrase